MVSCKLTSSHSFSAFICRHAFRQAKIMVTNACTSHFLFIHASYRSPNASWKTNDAGEIPIASFSPVTSECIETVKNNASIVVVPGASMPQQATSSPTCSLTSAPRTACDSMTCIGASSEACCWMLQLRWSVAQLVHFVHAQHCGRKHVVNSNQSSQCVLVGGRRGGRRQALDGRTSGGLKVRHSLDRN